MIFGCQGDNQDLAKGLWTGAVTAAAGAVTAASDSDACAAGAAPVVVTWGAEQAMELMKGAHAPMTRTGHSSAFDPDSVASQKKDQFIGHNVLEDTDELLRPPL